MFPRPEIIPSMRMIRQTAHERLQQMRDESPHAAVAETLLACLVVFQSPFSNRATRIVMPPDMDEQTRIAAFSILRYYNLVRPVSQRRYIVTASLKPLYTITEEVRERHAVYMLAINDDFYSRFVFNTEDVFAALLWSVQHKPDLALKIVELFNRRRWYAYTNRSPLAVYWHFILVQLRSIADRSNDTGWKSWRPFIVWSLGVEAQANKDLQSAKHWYEHALVLYGQGTNWSRMAGVVEDAAALAKTMGDIPQARAYYDQAFTIHTRARSNQAWQMVLMSFAMDVEKKNLEQVLALIKRHPQIWEANREHMAYKVGMLFLHYKRPLEARSLFAQAFGAASQRGGQNYISQNNILRGWGEAEHQLGNCQEGCRLCHLGRTVLHGLKEQVSNPLAMKEIDETEALIARLGCDEA